MYTPVSYTHLDVYKRQTETRVHTYQVVAEAVVTEKSIGTVTHNLQRAGGEKICYVFNIRLTFNSLQRNNVKKR